MKKGGGIGPMKPWQPPFQLQFGLKGKGAKSFPGDERQDEISCSEAFASSPS